ncbi:hypothetical protein EDD21DRAFT_375033 [Dissophora ornata]|nr:hypothetical protein EDD21DRAFT_375033 [Dissophora ornata]
MSSRMPRPTLPPECIELVLQCLHQNRDRKTLCTLLRVSKLFCQATLPYLYDDPFKPHRRKTSDYMAKLLYLLLRDVKSEHISPLLEAALDKSYMDFHLSEESRVVKVDYLCYLHHLNVSISDSLLVALPHMKTMSSYTRLDSLTEQPVFLELLQKSSSRLSDIAVHETSRMQDKFRLRQYFGAFLRRDVTWALCSPILATVRSLVIPLSDIQRYREVVSRLESLSRVVFQMENLRQMLPNGSESLETNHAQKAERFDSMLRFVEEHIRIFGNQLQAADCPDDTSKWIHVRCPEDVRNRLLELLPPLRRPATLDATNWKRFVSKADMTNLEHVCSIIAPSDIHQWRPQLVDGDVPFLASCRSLKYLDIETLGSNSFAWAAKERQSLEARVQNYHSFARSDICQSGASSPLCLIPLREVTLKFPRSRIGQEVEHIAFAFGDSLESIQVSCTFTSLQNTWQAGLANAAAAQTFIGLGWKMPRLQTLLVHLAEGRLVMDPETLSGCDELKILQLHDMTTQYRVQDIQRCRPANLPHLICLDLQGWPALTFHPETLRGALNLEQLNIHMRNLGDNSYFFIPVTEEQQQASVASSDINVQGARRIQYRAPSTKSARLQDPLWTWDWYLPRLTWLRLAAEFAFRFQFKMLRGCPQLVNLGLDIGAPEESNARRTLTKDDFFVLSASAEERNRSQLHQNVSQQQGRQLIVASSLRSLTLAGAWVIDPEVLSTLFGRVMPDVAYINEVDCQGFGPGGWLTALGGLKSLTIATSSQELTPEESVQLGLEEIDHRVRNPGKGPRYGFGDRMYIRKRA